MKKIKNVFLITAILFLIGCIVTFAITFVKANNIMEQVETAKVQKETILKGIDDYKTKNKELNIQKTKLKGKIEAKKVALTGKKPSKNDDITGPKTVYLTFDDGPSSNTIKILDVLKKYNAKATFFVTGNANDETKKEVFKRIVDEGHSIGIHTYTHEYSKVYASEDAFFEDLHKMEDEIFEYTGIRPKITRFPGGSNNTISRKYGGKDIMKKLVNSVTEKGYKYFDWNVSSGDSTGKPISKDQLVRNVVTDCKKFNKSVVLCHDSLAKKTTTASVEEIVAQLQQAGYQFKALDENSFAPQFYKPEIK